MSSIKVLGFDPGLQRLGFAVLKKSNSQIIPLNYGLISTSPQSPHPERLKIIYNDVQTLITRYQPNLISIETLIFAQNVTTAMSVSEVRGILLVLAALDEIPVVEFSPPQVKSAVCGYGRASKSQVQSAVKLLLGLSTTPSPDDVADAIAIAICGLYHSL